MKIFRILMPELCQVFVIQGYMIKDKDTHGYTNDIKAKIARAQSYARLLYFQGYIIKDKKSHEYTNIYKAKIAV